MPKPPLALTDRRNGNSAIIVQDRLTSREMRSIRAKFDKTDNTVSGEFKDQMRAKIDGLLDFRRRWLFNITDIHCVLKRCREMIEQKENDFCDFVVRTKMSFFNAGFEIWTPTKQKQTERFTDSAKKYPFTELIRDIWKEYLTTSNAVAYWIQRDKLKAEQLIDGMPRVMILNTEDVDYNNEFGIESITVKIKSRTLTPKEKAALGPRMTKAIEDGKLVLDPAEGDRWKVLTTAKLGNGFGMPLWRPMFDDLATRDLLRIGDWNGAWARKHPIRHGRKGHEIKDGPLAGMPEYFYTKKFGENLLKKLQGANGMLELITNFDLLFEYVYLKPDYFSPEIYKGVEDRLAKFAGACILMMREGNPNPNLSKIFYAEGMSERDVIGRFFCSIINDPSFLPARTPKGMEELQVRWDEWIFYDDEKLRQMITFGLQNGIMSPQTAQEAMALNPEEEQARMKEAHKRAQDFTPVFEAKQGGTKKPATTGEQGDAGTGGGDGRGHKRE